MAMTTDCEKVDHQLSNSTTQSTELALHTAQGEHLIKIQ